MTTKKLTRRVRSLLLPTVNAGACRRYGYCSPHNPGGACYFPVYRLFGCEQCSPGHSVCHQIGCCAVPGELL